MTLFASFAARGGAAPQHPVSNVQKRKSAAKVPKKTRANDPFTSPKDEGSMMKSLCRIPTSP